MEDATRASEQQWGDAAAAWERALEHPEDGPSAVAARWLLERAQLRRGDRVLELAAGAGRVGLEAAKLVEPGGRVLLTDLAKPMVEAARRHADRHGIPGVEVRVLDAQRADGLAGEVFDVVFCRNALMLMADPAAALATARGVLAPGGRLLVAQWGAADRNPWLSAVLRAVMDELGAPAPPPGTPGPFALGDPDDLEALVLAAGFTEVEVARLDAERRFASADAWWRELMEISGPLAALIAAMDADAVGRVRDQAERSVADHRQPDGGLVLPAELLATAAHLSSALPDGTRPQSRSHPEDVATMPRVHSG